MRRPIVMLALAAMLAVGLLAGPALAGGHGNGNGNGNGGEELPSHGHVLLLHADVEFVEGQPPILHGFRKCVELAGGQESDAHHERLHFGTAGEMLLTRAGHLVAPLAPVGPVEDCAGFEALVDD